ncbi:hypothetical protein ABT336_24245 [Micromonospora sp. NPDC000207]|uniref:hypothetical protein n=1 Tax=Micromonospora sp. NPDC000207 TaxID=3154246 RepID=UPI0033302A2D
MLVGTYVKKPVRVKAVRWDGTTAGATPIIDWILGGGGTASYVCADRNRCEDNGGDSPHSIVIRTLEGDMTASLGDWIIRGVQGEHYPIKDAIFRETYEDVE